MSILEGKNILLISPEPWDHIFVSKHHYAIQLAKRGNQVIYVGPPGSQWSLEESSFDRLRIVSYKGFLKGFRYLPTLIRRALLLGTLQKIEKLSGLKFDIIWSFDNSVFFDFTAFPHKILKISHIVDLNQNFMTGVAAKSADLCLCTTDIIRERLLRHNQNTFKISHGFDNSLISDIDYEVSMPGTNTIKAVYAGNLSMKYLDWKILEEASRKLTHVDFVFAGPNSENFSLSTNNLHFYKERMVGNKNVHFIGELKTSSLYSLYRMADILLVAYQEAHHSDQASPHKMIEYLASGKPIVATHTEEYLQFDYMIAMSGLNNNWVSLLKKTIEKLDYWNSEDLRIRRTQYALEHTYDKQIKKIEKIISKINGT